MTGLGVGGEFAVGVSLVAEVMPDRAFGRSRLGMLQALSAIGNMSGGRDQHRSGGELQKSGAIGGSAWRTLFLIGVIPALLVVPIFPLAEGAREVAGRRSPGGAAQKAAGETVSGPRALGSFRELFGVPRLAERNTIVGMLLAFAGVVGLWGIGFFSPDLMRTVFRKSYEGQGLSGEKVLSGKITLLVSVAFLLQNFGRVPRHQRIPVG